MQVTTIGLDIAKRVFQVRAASTPAARLWFEGDCGGPSCCRSSRGLRRA